MESLLGRQLNYTVHTSVYEGPLDLLLDLIERAELDITSVSLATVTDQYLAYIRELEQVNADEISAFLVIAAKLLQIKSEALLPRPPARAPGEEDLGRSLVDQLKLYKRFKEIGGWMNERQHANLRTFLRVAPPPKFEPKLDLSNLTLEKLVLAAQEAFAQESNKRPLGVIIAAPRVTIREKIDLITKMMKEVGRSNFRALLNQGASRLEVVVTFLAMLELVKRYRIQARQEGLFSEIEIDRSEDWEGDEEIDIEFSESDKPSTLCLFSDRTNRAGSFFISIKTDEPQRDQCTEIIKDKDIPDRCLAAEHKGLMEFIGHCVEHCQEPGNWAFLRFEIKGSPVC
jgi:segregation and condensation protein A